MFDNLRFAFFKKALRQMLEKGRRRGRRTHTFQTAKTIGLLFDASTAKDRQEILEWADNFVKSGKTVTLLGYFNEKQLPENPGFKAFSKKDLDWKGLPKHPGALAFADTKFDLLLTYNRLEQWPLAWIAACSQAAMKIGVPGKLPHDFDLLLETPSEKGLRFFAEQLALYLDKIIPNKYEPSSIL